MSQIISEIMEWCQNDKEYLQELIDRLQEIVDNEEEDSDPVGFDKQTELERRWS